MANIKQSVLNTFKRVGIEHEELVAWGEKGVKHTAANRFTGERVQTTPLVAKLIDWVYQTSNAYERGDFKVKVADFDRIRYFVLDQDREAYMACLD